MHEQVCPCRRFWDICENPEGGDVQTSPGQAQAKNKTERDSKYHHSQTQNNLKETVHLRKICVFQVVFNRILAQTDENAK